MPTKTRVYKAAVWIGWGLALGTPAMAQPDLDCAHPAETRTLLARLELAEIEGAEDVHRVAMWDAFGRCPDGAAGEACRAAETRRFGADWDRQKAAIQAKYRALLAEFEQRCRGLIGRAARPVRGAF